MDISRRRGALGASLHMKGCTSRKVTGEPNCLRGLVSREGSVSRDTRREVSTFSEVKHMVKQACILLFDV